MKLRLVSLLVVALFYVNQAIGQSTPVLASANSGPVVSTKPEGKQNVVRITGVRFAYPLVQHWIDEFNKTNPNTQIIIESRGSQDPSQYDILVEAYEQPEEIRNTREYLYFGQYAILPVANSKSAFGRTYSDKGLDKNLIKQIYFFDIYADKSKEEKINTPFNVYTRLQKAGTPIVFAKYFGFEQKDIRGNGIAGSDEHLLKAVLRDSIGVAYLPLSVIYDKTSQQVVKGLSVLPVDLNGNGRVSDEEKFYSNAQTVIQQLSSKESKKDIKNIPIEYLHLSVDKNNAKPEAVAFIKWVVENGLKDLEQYGYLQPEPSRLQPEKFEALAKKTK